MDTGNKTSALAKHLTHAGHSVRITPLDFEQAEARAAAQPGASATVAALGARRW